MTSQCERAQAHSNTVTTKTNQESFEMESILKELHQCKICRLH